MKVIEVPYGIANHFEDGTIEINEHLKEFPELYNSVMAHEIEHTDEPGFTKKDFLLDIGPTSGLSYWKLFKFMCIYPKTFLQFAPIYRKNKVWIYDINLSIVWGLLLLAVTLGIYLASV